MTDSRQVAWFEVYTYATRLAEQHSIQLSHLPIPGTPSWCDLPDDDARKLLALVLGGVREALTNEIRQERLADASHAIAADIDCAAIARRIQGRTSQAYIERKRTA